MPTFQYEMRLLEAQLSSHGTASSGQLSNGRLRGLLTSMDAFSKLLTRRLAIQREACVACHWQWNRYRRVWQFASDMLPVCGSNRVFEVATFQSRSSIVGNVFESAVLYLLVTRFELPTLASTPGNTDTHDIEVTPTESLLKPRGLHVLCTGTLTTRLPRSLGPDWSAPDTWKKAQANARNFRRRNLNTPFYIVSKPYHPIW